ncbi:hypothetical protein FRC10_003998 [Ceratobasidium sp. 414]|nr:hypothetical protein FRC10_003998 [Ceratobasidium sp. 414]
MVRLARTLSALGVFSALQMHVAAFSFVFTAPIQCGDLTVTWTGGTAPYYLLITPLFSTPHNLTIPDSAYNGTHGSYTTTLRVTGQASQRRFLLTMSDTTGFGTGGTSGLLTAGVDGNSQSCNLTDPGTDFTYQLNSALQQCRPYRWEGYTGAVQPVTIYGLIPLGKTFILSPPVADSYTWNANVASGTNIVFIMVDSQGRQGGSTDFYTVSASDDSSCINSNSPGSTAQSTAVATASSSPTSSPSGTTNNATVIGASIAGAGVLLIALASLIWFILQRKQPRRRHDEDQSSVEGMTHKRNGRSVDLIRDDQSGHSRPGAQYPLVSPYSGDPLQEHGRSVYDPDPYVLPPPSEAQGHFLGADEGQAEGTSGAPGPSRHMRGLSVGTMTTGGMSKAQMAASASVRSHGTQRFVLHTDAGQVDDNEVVELPPMYTQVQPRRDAAPTAPPSSVGGTTNGYINDPLRF